MPGTTPHPSDDPASHWTHQPDPDLPDLNTTDWRHCEPYLLGIDLFNLEYWWECHEILEDLWHAAGHGTPAAHALQAIIQCAAAQLKYRGADQRGAARLHAYSVGHARQSKTRMLGLDLPQITADTHTFLTATEATPAQICLKF